VYDRRRPQLTDETVFSDKEHPVKKISTVMLCTTLAVAGRQNELKHCVPRNLNELLILFICERKKRPGEMEIARMKACFSFYCQYVLVTVFILFQYSLLQEI